MRQLSAIALASLLVLPTLAHAQVNAEVLRPDRLAEGFAADVEGRFALARGNVELLDLGGGATGRYQTLYPPEPDADPELAPFVRQQVFLTADARVGERDDEVTINEGFSHARWTAMWHRRVGSEVFAQLQYNEFQRLTARALVGTGVRADALHRRSIMLWGGTGYMLEYNEIDVLAGASDDPETYEHRWSSYLAITLTPLQDALAVKSITYLQPRFDELSDYRLLTELEIEGRVTQAFSMAMGLTVAHDRAPPTGVRRTDLRLSSTLRLTL